MSNYDSRHTTNDYFYQQKLDEYDSGPADYNYPIASLENEDYKQQYSNHDLINSNVNINMNMNMKFIKDQQFNNSFQYPNLSSKSQPELSNQSYFNPNLENYYDQGLQTDIQINQYNQNSQNQHNHNHNSSNNQNNSNKKETPNHIRNVPTQIQMDLHQPPHLHHLNPTIHRQLPDITPHHQHIYPDHQAQSHQQQTTNLQHTTHPHDTHPQAIHSYTNAMQSAHPHANAYPITSQSTLPHSHPHSSHSSHGNHPRPTHTHSLSQPLVPIIHTHGSLVHTAPTQTQRKLKDYHKQSKKPKFHIDLDNITNHDSKNFINKGQYRNGMTTTGDLAIPFMKNTIFSPSSETDGFYSSQDLQDELLNFDDSFLQDNSSNHEFLQNLTPSMVPPKGEYFEGGTAGSTTNMKPPTSLSHQSNMFFSPQINYQEKTINNFSQNFENYLIKNQHNTNANTNTNTNTNTNKDQDPDISFNFDSEISPPSFKPIDKNFDQGPAHTQSVSYNISSINEQDGYLAQPVVERSNSYQSVNSNSSTTSKDVSSSNNSSTNININKPKKKRNPKGAVCTVCEKYISRDLTRHMRIHNDVGRFQCVYPKYMCNHKTQNFNRPYDYKKHLLHMHFKFDDPKGKTANTLTDKLPIHGSCLACGTRFIANDWLQDHVLTNKLDVRCPFVEDRVDRKEFDL